MPDAPHGIAVVTGASSGIGAAIARELARRGISVLAVARRAEQLTALSEAARVGGGAPIEPLCLDVTAPGSADKLAEAAKSRGGAAWLVNNAGVIRVGAMRDSDGSELGAMVRLNCESVVRITARLVPDMIARGGGRVLNVASLAGFQATPFVAVYGASKAFLLSLSEALAEELRGTGVTVTALCPGPVTTELFATGAPLTRRTAPGHEISAEACACYGIDAALAGRVVAVPGLFNRLNAMVVRLAPRSWVRRMSGRLALPYLGYSPPPNRTD